MLTVKWCEKNEFINEPALLFGFENPTELFKGACFTHFISPKMGESEAFSYDNQLVITGVGNVDAGQLPWIPGIRKGRLSDGTARDVYPIVNDPALPFRAGLTIHAAKGTWSSLPHKFEATEILTPRPMPFYEKFAYVTEQAGGWGAQCRIGYLYFARYEENDFAYPGNESAWVNDIVVIRDRDILDIPLGSHPVVSCPGNRLGYFWIYWTSGPTSDLTMQAREKF